MKTLNVTDVGKYFKKNSREMNTFFLELEWIKKTDKGWMLTEKGKEQGGIQKNFRGTLSVAWEEKIQQNKLLNNILIEKKVKNKEENNFRDKFKADYRTNDGHFVRSRAEVIICNWLYSENIAHAYEKRVPIEEEMYCDFYIPKGKVYIEFWGYEEDKKYIERKKKKIKLYKMYNLNLIEISNNSISNLDDILPLELLKFGINV